MRWLAAGTVVASASVSAQGNPKRCERSHPAGSGLERLSAGAGRGAVAARDQI